MSESEVTVKSKSQDEAADLWQTTAAETVSVVAPYSSLHKTASAVDDQSSSSDSPLLPPPPLDDDVDDGDSYLSSPAVSLSLPTYDYLARRCIERHTRERSQLRNRQLFIGIGGGPGSGKSTLSEAVATRINELTGQDGTAVVLPMDGFHHTRERLKRMAEEQEELYGSYDELFARRGAPWTYDAGGCVSSFVQARQAGSASLPIYSRSKSDPVPDGVTLERGTSIVLLEGNYLLAWDDPQWSPLREHNVFDETWFVACPTLDEQRERLVRRHLSNWNEEKARVWGEGRKGAEAKADANDFKNAKWVEEKSRHHAFLVVESK